MENAAFDDKEEEVARVLHKLAEHLSESLLSVDDGKPLVDLNGNRVGKWEVIA